jgi:hypothetical protein
VYRWIWQKLPFGLPGKLAGSVLLTALALGLLWFYVFPWAEPLLPFDDVQVSQDGGAPADQVGNPGGGPGPDASPPPGDGHELPYDTTRNNPTPTKSPSR